MPATSQIASTNERHSFVTKQSTQKRDVPNHIRRPPNAFMLFRSDFLKSQAVPPEVEKRQQNLSRIAGQCWNMLPRTEKDIWFSKAAVVRAEHRAECPSYTTGPFHRDKNRPLAKDKKRSANSGHSFGRFRTRRTRTPYCEGMFAALYESKPSSPESQASLISLTPASESPLYTTASLSPLSFPHVLPPFTSHTHSSKQDSPSAAPDNSLIRGDKLGYPLDSLGAETPQWSVIRDLEITSSEIGSFQELYSTFQPYMDDFASYVPHPGQSDPVAQVSLILPRSSTFPSASANFGGLSFIAERFHGRSRSF